MKGVLFCSVFLTAVSSSLVSSQILDSPVAGRMTRYLSVDELLEPRHQNTGSWNTAAASMKTGTALPILLLCLTWVKVLCS